tara:strand:- start:13572 stop:13943 length:372 start_codon:yes stop_codon:yes gene_type:complete
MNKVERTINNGYINNITLRDEMLKGTATKKESFITFVDGLENLYKEALNIRSHIFDNDGRDFKGWVYFQADKIKTSGGFQIAHHSAKESIFNELLELVFEGCEKPTDEDMQIITHKWDMWHYS